MSDRGTDCRTCNRRRIRCDRTLPLCSKCANKDLICPGYGKPLRWTNAIAVRGHLRGRTAPSEPQAAEVHKPTGDTDDLFQVSPREVATDDVTTTLERFTEPVIRRLLHHYEIAITPIMPWIDSSCNGYRRLILPLAESQPILRLAILATAAKHAAFDTGVDENLLECASETAITKITLRLSQLTVQNPDTTTRYNVDPVDMQAIIAAVLVLSDCSLLQSNLDVAQFHREGIRTLLNTLSCTTDSHTEMVAFLQNEAAAYDVLACTTLFEIDRVRDAVLPRGQDSIFCGFLRVVHGITMRSLLANHSSKTRAADDDTLETIQDDDNDDPQHCPTTTTDLENAFEIARGSTLISAGELLRSASETLKHDFICLVAAYHHAGLLYTCKRLPRIRMEPSAYIYHLGRLFDALENIREIRIVVSSLTWPLFIAGICSCDDGVRMHKVYGWFQLLVADTRYEHYNLLSDFLRELHESPQHDWIELAKRYERGHHPVVAI